LSGIGGGGRFPLEVIRPRSEDGTGVPGMTVMGRVPRLHLLHMLASLVRPGSRTMDGIIVLAGLRELIAAPHRRTPRPGRVDRLVRRPVGMAGLRLRGESRPRHLLQLLHRQSVRELALVLLLLLLVVWLLLLLLLFVMVPTSVVGAAHPPTAYAASSFEITSPGMRIRRSKPAVVRRTRVRMRTRFAVGGRRGGGDALAPSRRWTAEEILGLDFFGRALKREYGC
jgi:hypothetical protein